MCDRRLNGEAIREDIKFIAACNPYKRYHGYIYFNHTIHNDYAFSVASMCMHYKAHWWYDWEAGVCWLRVFHQRRRDEAEVGYALLLCSGSENVHGQLYRRNKCYNIICAGSTPLRHLVYRVLDLPASMKPLVYDYGSLCTATEQTYIRRIVENHVSWLVYYPLLILILRRCDMACLQLVSKCPCVCLWLQVYLMP